MTPEQRKKFNELVHQLLYHHGEFVAAIWAPKEMGLAESLKEAQEDRDKVMAELDEFVSGLAHHGAGGRE